MPVVAAYVSQAQSLMPLLRQLQLCVDYLMRSFGFAVQETMVTLRGRGHIDAIICCLHCDCHVTSDANL